MAYMFKDYLKISMQYRQQNPDSENPGVIKTMLNFLHMVFKKILRDKTEIRGRVKGVQFTSSQEKS